MRIFERKMIFWLVLMGTKKRAATEEEEEAEAEAALVFYYCTLSDRIQRFCKKKGKKVERGKGQEHATTKSTRRTTTPTNSHNKQLLAYTHTHTHRLYMVVGSSFYLFTRFVI
jgi:hypothetical protein